jgi:hypothetical protein
MEAKTDLKVEWVAVTPEVAQAYLESMRVNRPLSTANLKKIQVDMKEGRWHEDGGPLRFDKQGAMIDGQHRMWAIVETEMTFNFLVIRGVDFAAMATMDTGKSRSVSDIIGLYDPMAKDLTNLAACTTIAYRWEAGIRGTSLRNFALSNDEVLVFYDENKLALGEAARIGKKVSRHVQGATTQGFSLCAWVFERIDHEDAAFFWERLMDGVGLDEDSPIRALRELFLREARSSRPKMRSELAAAFTIKAWNAYREGRAMKVVSYRIGGASPERFPEAV